MRGAMVAHDELLAAAFLTRFRALQDFIDQVPMWRFRANRVGIGRIAREQECLTAASAKVFVALVARPARIFHPAVAAELVKAG